MEFIVFFQVELNRKYRMHDILTQKNMSTSTYINARTVFMRCQLPKGRYVILPTTFKPQTMGEYMIRVFTDVESGCRYVVQTPGDRRSQTREILERLRLRVCCCLPQPGEGVREQNKMDICVICSQKAQVQNDGHKNVYNVDVICTETPERCCF